MTRFKVTRWLGLAALLWAPAAASQQSIPGAPGAAPPPAAESEPPAAGPAAAPAPACYPACRDGFTCYEGKCVSLCNPPCPEGLECVAGKRCEPPLPGSQRGGVYEPPPPPVKSFENRSHTLLGFHLGFPGKLERDGARQDLATTLGFNVRGDAPIASYVLLGPMLQFGAWSPDTTPEPSSNYYVDLDLVVRVRAPLTTSKTNYQIWLGMPIGISVDVLGDEIPNVPGVGLGWNIGVLFGGAAHFTPKLGVFAEVAWLQHKMSHEPDVGPDLDFKLQQWCLNLGLAIKN